MKDVEQLAEKAKETLAIRGFPAQFVSAALGGAIYASVECEMSITVAVETSLANLVADDVIDDHMYPELFPALQLGANRALSNPESAKIFIHPLIAIMTQPEEVRKALAGLVAVLTSGSAKKVPRAFSDPENVTRTISRAAIAETLGTNP